MSETLHPDLGAALASHRMAGLADRARGRGPAARNQASAVGWPCPSGARYLVLLRTVQPDPTTPDLQAIFEEGDAQEDVVAAQLVRDGWALIKSKQPNKVWPRLNMSGRIDYEATIPKPVAQPLGLDPLARYIAEIKSMAPSSFDKATSIPAMMGARQPWLRAYASQLLAYLWLEETAAGIFVLKNKQSGELRFLPMHMDDWANLAGDIDERCQQVNAHIAAGTVPEVTAYDQVVCGRCRVRSACLPGEAGPGAEVILDDAMVEALQRRDTLAAAAAEYKENDEYVKSQAKALAAGKSGLWVCQDWELEVKQVNKHFKAQPAKPESDRVDTQVGIRRLKGVIKDEPAGA